MFTKNLIFIHLWKIELDKLDKTLVFIKMKYLMKKQLGALSKWSDT